MSDPNETTNAASHLLKTLYAMVDEIAGGLDPPKEYRTGQEVAAWTRGVLDVQRAVKKALNVS